MVLALIEGSRTAANTSTGNQDFTVGSTTAVPVAAMVVVTGATSATGTSRNNKRVSVGLTIGSAFQGGIASVVQHNRTTTVCDHVFFDDSVVKFPNVAGGADNARATFVAFIAGGIRLNWTNAPALAHQVHVYLWFGDNVKVDMGVDRPLPVGDPGEPLHITTNDGGDFKPDHLVCLGVGGATLPDEVYRDDWYQEICHAVRTPSDGQKTRAMDTHHLNAATTTAPAMMLDRDLAQEFVGSPGPPIAWTAGGESTLDATTPFDSTGFNIVSLVSQGPYFIWLAVSYGGNAYDLQIETTPTSTGVASFGGYGFRPWSVLALPTITAQNWTDGQQVDSAEAGTQGVAFFSDAEEHCVSWSDEDNVGTSDTSCRSIGKALSLRDDGDASLVYEADFELFDSDGFDLDFLTVAGTARKIAFFALEQDTITLTGDLGLPAMQVAAAAELIFQASGDQQLPAMQAAAVGELAFRASGDQQLAALQLAAVAELVFSASGDQQLPAMGVAAIGELVHSASGDLSLPALQVAAVGELALQGTSALQLPALQVTSAAELIFRATGAVALPAMQASVAGLLTHSGTSALLLPAMQLDATGTVEGDISGTGAWQLAAMQLSGVLVHDPPGNDCEVALLATYDEVLDLPAEYDEVLDLLATYDEVLDLPAEYDEVLDLPAEYDEIVDLEASFQSVPPLSGSHDEVTDLTGGHDEVLDLRATYQEVVQLSGSFGTVVDLEGSYDEVVDLRGSLC